MSEIKMKQLGSFSDTYMGLVELLKAALARLDSKLEGVDDQGLGWTEDKLEALQKEVKLTKDRVNCLRTGDDGEEGEA